MPRPSAKPAAYPFHTLRQQCAALEAAMGLILHKPGKKAVHQLRTVTRRIEAQLEILTLLEPSQGQLAGISSSTRKVGKLLAAVRKATGKVRDCDVQRYILRDAAHGSEAKPVHQDTALLRKTLKTHRKHAASILVAELNGHSRKLVRRLERVLKHFEPAGDLAIPAEALSSLIRTWYSRHDASIAESPTALHALRKAAKLARYMAESAALTSLAAEFENIQQAGGAWHDALTLCKTARRHLGQKSKLLPILTAMEEASLSEFHMTLGRDTAAPMEI